MEEKLDKKPCKEPPKKPDQKPNSGKSEGPKGHRFDDEDEEPTGALTCR